MNLDTIPSRKQFKEAEKRIKTKINRLAANGRYEEAFKAVFG